MVMLLVAVVASVLVLTIDVVVVSCGQLHSDGDSGFSQSHTTGTSDVVVTVVDVDVVVTSPVVGMHADSLS